MENETEIMQENKLNQKKELHVPSCCSGCIRWKQFSKKCFYYWEAKKHCTMWTSDFEEAALQQL